MAKHVIILGAGASATSGYLQNKELGVILSQRGEFDRYMNDKGTDQLLREQLLEEFSRVDRFLHAFREGHFETVDEFSFQSRNHLKPVVQYLKWLTSWIFVLHDPQQTHGPDYQCFAQKLFSKTLPQLREDIAVLTYNYDAYFEFVLLTMLRARWSAAGKDPSQIPTSSTSGFGDLDAKGLLAERGFCYLKLHGTGVLPLFVPPNLLHTELLTFCEVFEERGRLARLPHPVRVGCPRTPPIFFPWEVITEAGEFVTQGEFRHVDPSTDNRRYHPLFKAIWRRARREVAEADKLSFVGFSAHEFMEPGLRFLLKSRKKAAPLEVVTANPESVPKGHLGHVPPAGGHVDRLTRRLQAACPGLRFAGIPSGKRGLGEIVCYPNFEDFIRVEM